MNLNSHSTQWWMMKLKENQLKKNNSWVNMPSPCPKWWEHDISIKK